jgi:ATP-dependent Clp protease ATP-binding subunit ClpA
MPARERKTRPMTDGDGYRVSSGLHPDYQSEVLRLREDVRARGGSPRLLAVLAAHAEDAARTLDDNHVGTEHVTLALFRAGPNPAKAAMEEAGVTEDVYRSVLAAEPGPSPDGPIPRTARAVMISGLTVTEADRLSAREVRHEHVLLAVIRESERWETQHAWGPLHLRSAAESAGSSLADIEARLMARL